MKRIRRRISRHWHDGRMRGDEIRVLVVGAGIAGLAAARTLRDRGALVDVVDRAPSADRGGFGMYLPGNAVRALDALGLGAEVLARAAPVKRQRISDHRGRVIVEVDVDGVWGDVGPCLGLRRSDLCQVLLDTAPAVPVSWGVEPRAIRSEDGGARVAFSDGGTGRYDLVVGADGAHSTVRSMIFDGAAARPVGQYARRFLAPWPDAEPVWSVMMGRGVTFLTVPIGAGHVYCYSDTPMARRDVPLREVLAGFAEPVPALLAAAIGSPHGSPVEEVALPSWVRGPVVLVGDAAHATSPNMAEGVAMAVEDAIVLAGSLVDAPDVPRALAAYERRRRPRTDWVAAQTHRRDRLRGLPSWLRTLVLGRFGEAILRANYRPLRDLP